MKGLNFMELTYSIDGAGRMVLGEVAKGRDPPLRWLRPNYEEYVEECGGFGMLPVDWDTYQRRFLEFTGVDSNDPVVRAKQAWNALFSPGEQITALTVLRGRRRWFRRRRWE